jgi:hypothetical protein
MEPISVIGIAGTVLSIGASITRSILFLVSLQGKYQTSSLVVSSLIGQLATLKAALNQITQWISDDNLVAAPLDEQLEIDLQISLESCEAVISALEEGIDGLGRAHDDGGLSVKGKISYVFNEGNLSEFSNLLSNQAVALNLLLTALNW